MVLVAAVAALVGFWGLDQANIGPDELIYQDAGLRYVLGDTTPNPEHPPVAKYLLGVWQLVFGAGVTSARVLMGVVLVATTLVAFCWARAAFGATAGVVGAIMLATTHRVSGADFIDRQVLLDPFSVLFGLSGLALLWHWERQRRMAGALAAGALLALGMLSKASAATLLIAAVACLPWRELGRREVWGAMVAFAAAGIGTCLLAYAPLGGLTAVQAMLEFQGAHASAGHPIVVAGETFLHAPWYALVWFAGEVVGWLALAAVVGSALIAAGVRWRDRATRVLVLAATGPLLVLSASPVALPHYTSAWLWPVLLLSGVGVVEVWRRARSRIARVVAGGLGALLLVGPWTGVAHVVSIAPTGVARVDAAMAADPAPDGVVLTVQLSPWITDPNIDAAVTEDERTPGITAVIVGDDIRFPAPPTLLDAVAAVEEPLALDGVLVYLLDEELSALIGDGEAR